MPAVTEPTPLDGPLDGPLAAPLLRLATAGSVDDGKSTLVGRLLHDTRSVLADQLAAVARASRDRGLADLDLSLLTDGLRAEREQGITIDVAYRYFATPRRTFVLADTPGHVQYTRNMVTGASTAELAVVLVDAVRGVVEQTRRHLAVAALLAVPHVALAVNKMDLVGYAEDVFVRIRDEVSAYAAAHGVDDVVAIPVSALRGDNVVERSTAMPWYLGPTLLEHLESVPTGRHPAGEALRLPVQYVLRADGTRRYAGQVASGELCTGDEVVVLPEGRRTRVAALDLLGQPVARVAAPQSVAVVLAHDLDVARGSLLVHPDTAPTLVRRFAATVCCLDDRPLRAGDRVLLRHTTRTVRAVVDEVRDRLDVDTLERARPADGLQRNDIGHVLIRTADPLPLDAYTANRRTGSFLLIDPYDGSTLAAGLAGAAGDEFGDGPGEGSGDG